MEEALRSITPADRASVCRHCQEEEDKFWITDNFQEELEEQTIVHLGAESSSEDSSDDLSDHN